MLSRAAWHPSAPRWILGVLSVAWAILAAGTSQLPYVSFPAWVWSAFYALASIACAWSAIDLRNRRAVAVAGAATIIANLMRGGLLIAAWLDNDAALSGYSALTLLGGVTAWWTLSFVCAQLFFRRVTPLASVERMRE